jgi:two-component system NarL family sensor kinase
MRTPITGQALRALAAALGAVVVIEVIAAAVLSVIAGWSWQDALDGFVITNSAIGLSFGICGPMLAWHRDHHLRWVLAVVDRTVPTAGATAIP